MRITPISEIFQLENDQPVMAVHAAVTAVYEQHTGEGQYGPWSIQNIKIKDASGEIKAVLKDRPLMENSWKGRMIEILCVQNEKKGWVGVKTKDDTNRSKNPPTTERVLWVTGTAETNIIEEGAPAQQQQQQAPRGQQHAAPAGAPAPAGNAVVLMKRGLMQAANAYLLVLDAATYVAEAFEAKHGIPLSGEHFQAMSASLFIWLDRSSKQGIAALPTVPIPAKAPAAPTALPPPPPPKPPTPPPAPEPPADDYEDDDIPF